MKTRQHKNQVWLVSSVAAIGGFLFGFDTGVISGTQLYFTEYFQLSSAEQGWAVSSALYGALLGAAISGLSCRIYGRKKTLLVAAVLFLLSAIGSGWADSLSILVLYRALGGLGVGLASMAAPMYIAEISPAQQRGKMVSLYQLAIVIGFFVVFVVTYVLGDSSENQNIESYRISRAWRLMFWSEIIPAALFLVLLIKVPFSPRFLVYRNRETAALEVLEKLMPSDQAKQELMAIRETKVTKVASQSEVLRNKKWRWILILGILLSILQQASGINAILYYGAEIFSEALNYGSGDALKQQLWIGGTNLIFTIVALIYVDRWGRRPLLIYGSLGMIISLLALGGLIYFQQFGWAALAAILIYCGSFSLSLGPVVWVLLSELFPSQVRSTALAIAVAFQWLFNAIIAGIFPIVNKSMLNVNLFHGALPYFGFAIITIFGLIFIYRFVPETKNKRLEELESFWNK